MQTITTIGLDIAKSVFQVHGVDADGQVVVRRQVEASIRVGILPEATAMLVGIEACAPAHHSGRASCNAAKREESFRVLLVIPVKRGFSWGPSTGCQQPIHSARTHAGPRPRSLFPESGHRRGPPRRVEEGRRGSGSDPSTVLTSDGTGTDSAAKGRVV